MNDKNILLASTCYKINIPFNIIIDIGAIIFMLYFVGYDLSFLNTFSLYSILIIATFLFIAYSIYKQITSMKDVRIFSDYITYNGKVYSKNEFIVSDITNLRFFFILYWELDGQEYSELMCPTKSLSEIKLNYMKQSS